MDKKRSKLLSWFRNRGSTQKNQRSSHKALDSNDWKRRGSTLQRDIPQPEQQQCCSTEAVSLAPCCCQHISEQMQSLNVCNSSSYHNVSRNRNQHYLLANECTLCKEVRREHLHPVKENMLGNKENVPGLWCNTKSCCCQDSHHDCQKFGRSEAHLCEYSDCNLKQGCVYCSQAVMLAPKCLRRQLRSCDINTEDNNYQCKYRSIGVNTTPEQIAAAGQANLCSLKDCGAPSLCQNVPLLLNCKKIPYQHIDHLKESKFKIKDRYFENEQFKTSHRHSRKENNLPKPREDFASTAVKCDYFATRVGQTKISTANRIRNDSTDSNRHRQRQRNEKILKARVHNINKTLPKSWKHKTALKDDDSKSTFADDEKSELDSSGGTNYFKHTCL